MNKATFTNIVAWPLIAVLATTSLAFAVARLLPHANLSLLFLTGVLIVSARLGLWPGLVASLLSFLAFNFLFTPPFYSLSVHDDGDVATLVFFLLMATITGNLAARMWHEMVQHRSSLARISHLFEFSARLSSASGSQQILDLLASEVAARLNCPVFAAAFGKNGAYEPRAEAGGHIEQAESRLDGFRTEGVDGMALADGLVAANLSSPAGDIGVVLLDLRASDTPSPDRNLLRSLCDQAAIALDRTLLEASLEQARVSSENERLRSALLSSLSHDLRTPLASVIGSTSSLIDYGGSFSEQNRAELLATTLTEARRLDRYIQNLLDMTRLGHGKLSLDRSWVDLHDMIASVQERVDCPHDIGIDTRIDKDIPMLWVHGALMEQALVNLLDNAIRFSPPGSRIDIRAERRDGQLLLEIRDQGIGIPDADKERVFDMFYTVGQGDRGQLQGTGLGLAICRGMIAAHMGTVTAADGPAGQGTRMIVRLPLQQPPGGEAAND